MPPRAVLDNDVLIKCAAYRLLKEVVASPEDDWSVGSLGAARFVVPNRLARHPEIVDGAAAVEHWQSVLEHLELLEPNDVEEQLASDLEEAALRYGLDLDSGESQLCAMVIERMIPLLITGDKRAIVAIERLLNVVDWLLDLGGRVGCLEQLADWLCGRLGADSVRGRICTEPGADRALSVCFSCAGYPDYAVDPEGLRSYIDALRLQAPRTLTDALRIPPVAE